MELVGALHWNNQYSDSAKEYYTSETHMHELVRKFGCVHRTVSDLGTSDKVLLDLERKDRSSWKCRTNVKVDKAIYGTGPTE
jgi:hypothetical protein